MTPASVLAAYATRYGSTQEVAEAVAGMPCESGLSVELKPMREVRSITGCISKLLSGEA